MPIETQDATYLLELRRAQVQQGTGLAFPASMFGTTGTGVSEDEYALPDTSEIPIYLSDTGWIGEPTDATRPNINYLSRLLEKPSIQRTLPIYPGNPVRETGQGGEVVLDNQDDSLSYLSGQWSLAGRDALLLRGPRPGSQATPYSSFEPVAKFVVTQAGYGTDTIRIQMNGSIPTLGQPVCTVFTGDGFGGGTADMAGQSRPLLVGILRSITPQLLSSAKLAYTISSDAISDVKEVRIQGMPVAFKANYATGTALFNAVMSTSQQEYATCLAEGMIRFSFIPAGPVTLEARSAGVVTLRQVFDYLLTKLGGVNQLNVAPGYFSDPLFQAPAGFYFTSGSIEEAMDQVLGSVAGWWGTNTKGQVIGGVLGIPGTMTTKRTFEDWMLDDAPVESAARAPMWQVRVEHSPRANVLGDSDVVAAAGAEVKQRLTGPGPVVGQGDSAVKQLFPLADNPEPIKSAFYLSTDAQALALHAFQRYGVPRRLWAIEVGIYGHGIDLGDEVRVVYGALAGKSWIVVGKSENGDKVTLTIWG